VVRLHQLDQARAALDVVGTGEAVEHPGDARNRLARDGEIGGAHDLALAHGNAALNLGEVFTDPDLDDQLFDFAERSARLHAFGIGRELAHRFDVGREPSETVGGALLAIEQPIVHLIVDGDALTDRARGIGEQCLGRERRLARKGNQLCAVVAALRLVEHSSSPRAKISARQAVEGVLPAGGPPGP
jgi:hypothetical protein